ncbi:MAG: hypothetical protein PHX43_07020 [Alphaproteobacteria bacterium]|nr:hypothetical protein [Alphaproteobacteria bacterium]
MLKMLKSKIRRPVEGFRVVVVCALISSVFAGDAFAAANKKLDCSDLENELKVSLREALNRGSLSASQAAHAEMDKAIMPKPVKNTYCVDSLISNYFGDSVSGMITDYLNNPSTPFESIVAGVVDDGIGKLTCDSSGAQCVVANMGVGDLNSFKVIEKCNLQIKPWTELPMDPLKLVVPGNILEMFGGLEKKGQINNYNNSYSFPYKQ